MAERMPGRRRHGVEMTEHRALVGSALARCIANDQSIVLMLAVEGTVVDLLFRLGLGTAKPGRKALRTCNATGAHERAGHSQRNSALSYFPVKLHWSLSPSDQSKTKPPDLEADEDFSRPLSGEAGANAKRGDLERQCLTFHD
jgi:hypothetical protein